MAKSNNVIVLKTLMLVLSTVFGLWDEVSDFIYVFTEETHDTVIKKLLIFFLVASWKLL